MNANLGCDRRLLAVPLIKRAAVVVISDDNHLAMRVAVIRVRLIVGWRIVSDWGRRVLRWRVLRRR
jgi:hypothetical protein